MKRFAWFLVWVMLCFSLTLSSCDHLPGHSPPDSESEDPVTVDSPLTVYFLKLGAADCMILQTEAHTVIIDTGEKEHGENITDVLTRLGVETVDYLILSHPDKDHIGGAPKVLETGLVKTVLLPDYVKESTAQSNLNSALKDTEASVRKVTETVSFVLDEITFTVYPTFLYPVGTDTSNERSLGVLVEHGNNRLFFAGDAVGERLTEMIGQIPDPQSVDLLKVPHHGRFDSRSDDLIDALRPSVAVIFDSKKEPAENRLLALLGAVDADIYRTCYGAIIITSDGNALHVEEAG